MKRPVLPYARNFEIFSSPTASVWLYGQNNWQTNIPVVSILLFTTNYLLIAHQTMKRKRDSMMHFRHCISHFDRDFLAAEILTGCITAITLHFFFSLKSNGFSRMRDCIHVTEYSFFFLTTIQV